MATFACVFTVINRMQQLIELFSFHITLQTINSLRNHLQTGIKLNRGGKKCLGTPEMLSCQLRYFTNVQPKRQLELPAFRYMHPI